MRIAALLVLLLVASPVYFPAPSAAQQYDIPGASSALRIVVSPAQPAPKSTARLTLQSPLYDLDNSLIAWRVNGEPLSEGEGLKTVSINMGAAGDTTEVTAALVSGDDEALAFIALTPAGLDLMWEAEGFTPALYRGRTLASPGSRLTLVAYPTFMQGGTRIPEKDLVFTWRNTDTVLGSLSGRGKSSITLDRPILSSADIISVEARTLDGSVSSIATTRIAAPETPLRLYQNHPLFGPLFHKALSATTFTPDSEMTFLAIPYFAPARSENDPALSYEWRVNQQDIPSDAKRPSQVTINAQGSDGIALIELIVGHVSNFFFGTDAAWQVTFSAAGGGGDTDNPFSTQYEN